MARKNKDKPFVKLIGIAGVIMIIIVITLYAFNIEPQFSFTNSVSAAQIVVVPIEGAITLESAEEMMALVEKADSSILTKAIILEINSPGGTVVASKELADVVKNTKKPTVSLIREVGASGAYWVASATDLIVADPASITGSIGVTGSYLEISGLMEKYGVGYERLVSGPYKDTGTPYRKLTSSERMMLLDTINSINTMFITAIAENRGLSETKVKSIATGETFLGIKAKALGLVNILGGEAEAQKAAEQLAGVSASKLVYYELSGANKGFLVEAMQSFAYQMGKGIGDSWNPMSEEQQDALMAELN